MRRLIAAAVAVVAFAALPLAPASACDQTRPDCNPPGKELDRVLCVVRRLAAGEPVQPTCTS